MSERGRRRERKKCRDVKEQGEKEMRSEEGMKGKRQRKRAMKMRREREREIKMSE